MKRFIIIISLLFFTNSIYSNELPALTYFPQPSLKLNNDKIPTIVKFDNIKIKEKEEKNYKVMDERSIINNSPRRTYRNCTSLG